MSEYLEKQRSHLKEVLLSLAGDDLLVYEPGDPDRLAWYLLYQEKDRDPVLMSASYSGVTGLSVSLILKKDKLYGTGYSILEPGLYAVSKKYLLMSLQNTFDRLTLDLLKQPDRLLLFENEIRSRCYKSFEEYAREEKWFKPEEFIVHR